MRVPLLTYENLCVSYGDQTVLQDVNLCVYEGGIVGIVGESGSGKSTILRATMGLLGRAGRIQQGQIRYGGSDLALCSSEELRSLCGSEIGMIFQDCLSALTPIRTIGGQLYEEYCVHAVCRESKEIVLSRAARLLRSLSLAEPERVLASYPFELSGGIGQRVGIAAAMLLEPKVILADEPTSALDVVSQKQVLTEFVRLKEKNNTAFVFVSHNIAAVRAVADYVVVLKDGKIMEQGKAKDVLTSPRSSYTQELLAAVPSLVKEVEHDGA